MKTLMIMMMAAVGVLSALAATTIGYSGQLLDATGQKLGEGQRNVTVTFKLYGGSSDMDPLWQVERAVLLNADGYFSVELEDDGTQANKLETVLERSTLYLGLTPKGANEIQPRQRILPNPRAVVAERGVDDFKVEGTATIKTVKAEAVQQKYDGKYCDLLPKGAIIMWAGTTIPDGWALCNGNEGKTINGVTIPDLRGRFIVGSGTDEYAVGSTGGEKEVLLTIDHLPRHWHTVFNDFYLNNGSEYVQWEGYSSLPQTAAKISTRTSEEGGKDGKTLPHENRPPYYALAYIIKVM